MFAARFDPGTTSKPVKTLNSDRDDESYSVKCSTEVVTSSSAGIGGKRKYESFPKTIQDSTRKRKVKGGKTIKCKKPKTKDLRSSECNESVLPVDPDEDTRSMIEVENEHTQALETHQGQKKTEEIRDGAGDQVDIKHLKVFHRFQQTMKLKGRQKLYQPNEGQEEKVKDHMLQQKESERHDLISLPQPELPQDKVLSSLATLNQKIDWLAKPIYYTTRATLPFQKLNLPPSLLKNILQKFGYKEAFSVQISVIQALQHDIKQTRISNSIPGDLLANAPTGSGKTLGYCVPIVQAILGRRVSSIKCIILAPTKPLVSQVYSTLNQLCTGTDLNVMELRNDTVDNEKMRLTSYELPNYPDIIVSTPGRLLEHLNANRLKLHCLRFLVVDEADRILHSTSFDWCAPLLRKINNDRSTSYGKSGKSLSALNLSVVPCQKLVFSATLTTDAEKLSHLQLYRPRLLVVNDHGVESGKDGSSELYQLPPSLDELSLTLSNTDGVEFFKPLILFKLLTEYVYRARMGDMNVSVPFKANVLVFIRSNEASARMEKLLDLLAEAFRKKLRVKSVNSLLDPETRERRFHDFTRNKIDVLVATDVMARGMDLPNINHVINYDLPGSTREYVHRVGRTARANKFGVATSFVLGDGDRQWLRRLTQSGVINRNGKTLNDIPVTEEIETRLETSYQDTNMEEDGIPKFLLALTEPEKLIYTEVLAELGYEIKQHKS
ncbi:RNA helicase [Komagataella phaffii CBS 7435]|uniref:ATP-dependent RNA helicase n=2 Tax=Komagataella phaffii TaxID=460519 RepID=C4R6J9_KOMPG|nr:Essential protein involved in ribosome biogenesis [Komagataella phaffii GS115]AOA63926.1 GQ67_04257T0 [Komagataella phaffii]CAH2448969.1 RNA helicase [Komagataella phaffii CBS 7435]AOA68766.1 GQ68_04229T0 [Komagataella phaffii GS115]CAY71185.1 Essential protein involved in ribosome biogenesis [Komagataella phaffii GS115]CCA39018.1 RNA helicase [Komagataella phaffii CBS 7435]